MIASHSHRSWMLSVIVIDAGCRDAFLIGRRYDVLGWTMIFSPLAVSYLDKHNTKSNHILVLYLVLQVDIIGYQRLGIGSALALSRNRLREKVS